MKHKFVYKAACRLMAVLIAVESISVSAAAANKGKTAAEIAAASVFQPTATADSGKTVTLKGTDVNKTVNARVTEYLGIKDCVYSEADSSIEYTFNAPARGNYTIEIVYAAVNTGMGDIPRTFSVNGKTEERLSNISLPRCWADCRDENGNYFSDAYGNQLSPQQKQEDRWLTSYLYCYGYYETSAAAVALEKGKNTFTVSGEDGSLVIREIRLICDRVIPRYDEYAQKNDRVKEQTGVQIAVEAEKTYYKSHSVLIGTTDHASAEVTPSDPYKQCINVIGGTQWNTPGQYLVWKITVPKDGLYEITLKERKNLSQGCVTYRRLYIDDEVPFAECEALPFVYSTAWKSTTLGGSTPYKFYLTGGEHTLKLEATSGIVSEVLGDAAACLSELNLLYRQLLMVIGASPDVHRDYGLQEKVPQIISGLEKEYNALEDVYNRLIKLTTEKGNTFSTLDLIMDVIKRMYTDPNRIPAYFGQFKTYLGSFGNWISTMQQSPLQLDKLIIHSPGAEAETKTGFFKKLGFFVNRVIASYVVDYNNIGNTEKVKPADAVTVWFSGGRDQFQAYQTLVNDGTLQKKGVNVDLKLVAGGILLKSIVAGRGPDVMIGVSSNEIVNYALRGALANIDEFDDYGEVMKSFPKNADVPLSLEGKCYGLPGSMNFNLMFYRKDILSELGIAVPQTWDDVTRTISVLAKSNLEFGLPSSFDTFYTFLIQSGGKVYNDIGSRVAFDDQTGLQAFRRWTAYFADYGQPYTYDFQNRFRTGEMPIGISSYLFGCTLSVSAPEISNLWTAAVLPGTKRADGSIDRSSSLGFSASVILSNAKNKKKAWEFLKWNSSTDVQVSYGYAVEGIMGMSARSTTANLEAMNRMAWSPKEKKILNEQISYGVPLKEVPGSYIMSRSLSYAWTNVVVQGKPYKETLLEYISTINAELTAKREEFGLPV